MIEKLNLSGPADLLATIPHLLGITPAVQTKSAAVTPTTQAYDGVTRKPNAQASDSATAARSNCARRPVWSATQPQT